MLKEEHRDIINSVLTSKKFRVRNIVNPISVDMY